MQHAGGGFGGGAFSSGSAGGAFSGGTFGGGTSNGTTGDRGGGVTGTGGTTGDRGGGVTGTGGTTGDDGTNRDRNQGEPSGTGGTDTGPVRTNQPPAGQRTLLFEPGNSSFTAQVAEAAGQFDRDRARLDWAFTSMATQPRRAA